VKTERKGRTKNHKTLIKVRVLTLLTLSSGRAHLETWPGYRNSACGFYVNFLSLLKMWAVP